MLCAALAPGLAAAQEAYSPLVPRGKIRLEIRGEYSSFSSRYRTWTDGSSTRGGIEDLGDPFSGPVGTRVFPLLIPGEAAVRQALGDDYGISLGTMTSFIQRNTMAFEAASVTGIPATLPLADAFLSPDDIMTMVTDPAFVGIGASHPLDHWRAVWGLGDIEVRTDARLLESGAPDGPRHVTAGAGLRLRLPTGAQDDPANFLDAAAADGQIDVELRGWMNGRWTGRFGLWADFRYGIQLPGTTERRVFDPNFTFAPICPPGSRWSGFRGTTSS